MFTDDELEEAVLRYLTAEVVTVRSEAGMRDIVATKQQVYEIISSAFMLRPGALFAVCWMASNRLTAQLSAQRADLDAIYAAAPRVGLTSQRIGSTSDLHNAAASLVTLTAAFSARAAGVAGSIGPAIQRFGTSVERFARDELAKNVVAQGDVVKTPEELRADIKAHWATARARHADIVETLDALTTALMNFAAVRLPDTVVSTLLARIQGRLTALTEQMAAPSAAAFSRQALLELMAMRTLLRQAATFRPPVLVKSPLTGDATNGVLTGAAGRPACIVGTVSGPYHYAPASALTYSVAGATRTHVLPGQSATVADVLALLRTDGRLVVTTERRAEAPFVGRRSATAPDMLEHHVVSGTALVTNGTTDATAESDLEALGVRPGMRLVLGDHGTSYRVEAVHGPRLTLSAVVAAGQTHYHIGPDYAAVRPGTAVTLSGSADAGVYRVTEGRAAALRLDRALVSTEPVRVSLLDERLAIALRDVKPDNALVVSPGPGADALGLHGSAVPAIATFDTGTDLGARGVVVGDLVTLHRTPATTHEVTHVVGTTVTLAPPAPYTEGAIRYEIRDARVASYLAFVGALGAARAGAAFTHPERLEQVMARLVGGARFNGELVVVLEDYLASLAALHAQAAAYVVPRDATIEQAVRVMQEHGFDRAADLFLALRLREFFALDADGVSYKTWVVRAAANAAREVVPVSKDSSGTGWRTLAIQPNESKG